MSQIIYDEFESGVGIYDIVGPGVSVVSDSTLGGSHCIQTSGANDYLVKGPMTYASSYTPLPWNGRQFHVSMRVDHSETPWSTAATYDGPFGVLFEVGRQDPGEHAGAPYNAYGDIWLLFHGGYDATTGFLRLLTNAGTELEVTHELTGVFAKDTIVTITTEGEVSTITGGDDNGGGTAASDGWIRITVGSTVVYEQLNFQLGLRISNQGPNTYWHSWANVVDPIQYVKVQPLGRGKYLCVRDDLLDCSAPSAVTTQDANLSTPCCANEGGTTNGGGGGDTGTNPNPVGFLPWEAACIGGAAVDTIADLADGETW